MLAHLQHSRTPKPYHTIQQSNVTIKTDIPLSVVALGPNCQALIACGFTGNTPVALKPAITFFTVRPASQAGVNT